MKSNLKAGDTVWDFGANIGGYSLLASKIVGRLFVAVKAMGAFVLSGADNPDKAIPALSWHSATSSPKPHRMQGRFLLLVVRSRYAQAPARYAA